MNSTHYLTLSKALLLMVPVGLYFSSSSIVHAGDKTALSLGLVRSKQHLEYRAELPQGYLKVYSATDPFDDGGLLYYAHSSYAIYTVNGKLFKRVENHMSRSDELPEMVSLPAGSYIVEARSEKDGYIRRPVTIKEERRTILDLDRG